MKKDKIVESKEHSFYIKHRRIPKGCRLCLEGKKTVLFLNGTCQNPSHCYWYCPISKERKNKHQSFANEIPILKKEDLIKEIGKSRSMGISITGGDPLFEPNLKQTLDYIKFLKNNLGKKFHIHLYTNGLNFDEKIAQQLVNSGLDEIRFNPPRKYWNRIKFALNKGMVVGAEVPAIPDDIKLKELEELIYFLDKIGADFININEFEYVMPNSRHLKERNFYLKAGSIASVKDSKEKALDLIEKVVDKVKIKIHFCSVLTKDYWQLRKRYSRRAKSIRKPFEEITEEGLLLYASIKGDSYDLDIIENYFISNINLSKKFYERSGKEVNFLIDVALDDEFQSFMKKKNLIINVMETTPFLDKKFRQITETIPIELFKTEFEYKKS